MAFKRLNDRNTVWDFLLGVVAFSYAAAIRFAYVRAMPDPFFFPDSRDYLHPVLSLLHGGKFEFAATRPPGYSLFLAALLVPTRSFLPLLVAQHGLTLMTALATGLIFYFVFRKSAAQAWILFFLVSVLPQEVALGHAVLTESLYSFLLILAVGLFFWCVSFQTSAWRWLLPGSTVAAAVFVRPVGWSLAAALVVSISFFQKGRQMIRSFLVFLMPLTILMGSFIWYNHRARGFTGLDQLGGSLLLCANASLLEVSAIPDKDLRALLIPIWEKNRDKIEDRVWCLRSSDSPVAAISGSGRFKENSNNVMLRLGFQAVKDHPWRYIGRHLYFLKYPFQEGSIPFLQPKARMLYSGFQTYWDETASYPEARRRLSFRPEISDAYFAKVLHTPVYPYQTTTVLTRPLRFIPEVMPFLPAGALIASLMLLFRNQERRAAACLLCIVLAHFLLTNIFAETGWEVRYAVPVEPLYCILLFAGLGLLRQGTSLSGRTA